MDKNIFAAIAMALYEDREMNVHDFESGKITIIPKHTQWDSKFITFTSMPSSK